MDIKAITIEQFKMYESESRIIQTPYSTSARVEYLKKEMKLKPVFFELSEGGKPLSVFVGMVFSKYGVRILGSPFEGWSCCNMGFCNFKGAVEGDEIYKEMLDTVWAFAKKHCRVVYFECVDFKIPMHLFSGSKNCLYIPKKTPILNMENKTADDLFKLFKTDCRNFIRQFERRGAELRVVEPSKEFAEKYYDQLIEVFGRQNLRPYKSKAFETTVIEHYKKHPEQILCLQVIEPENGECIASSYFFGHHETAYYMAGASYRKYCHYRPNEYMIWYAIQYWLEKGVKYFDMVGVRSYKLKFGPDIFEYPRIIYTRYKFLFTGRAMAKKAILFARKIKGKFTARKTVD